MMGCIARFVTIRCALLFKRCIVGMHCLDYMVNTNVHSRFRHHYKMLYPLYGPLSSECGVIANTATIKNERRKKKEKEEGEEGVSISEQSVFPGDGPTFC